MSSQNIATLSIDIVAGLAKLEGGLQQAVQITDRQAKAIEQRFSQVGNFIKGLGLAAIVADQVNGIRSAIDLADSVDDLAEKYGVAADKLSQYRFASEVAGTTTEAFAVGLNKLSKTMAAAAGGDKTLSEAFKAIHVQVKNTDGSLRSVDEVLLDVSDRFSRYEDGAAKAALAQQFFGKTGADMIPLLNKGAGGISALTSEAQKLGAAFGSDVAKQAGDFNDNLKRVELAAQGAKVALAGELLPTLNATLSAFIENRKEAGTFVAILQTIKQGVAQRLSLDDQGRLAAQTETQTRDLKVLTQQYELFNAAAKSGNANAAKQAERLRGQIEGVQRAIAKTSSDLKYMANLKDPTVNSDALSRRLDRGEGSGKKPAPVISTNTKDGSSEIEKADKFTKSLIARLQEKIEVNKLELSVGRELTEAERLRLDVAKDVASTDVKLTASQRARIGATVEEAVVTARARQEQVEANKQREIAAELAERELQSLLQIGQSRVADNQQLRDYIQELGKSADEVERLHQARIEDAIAQEKQNLSLRINSGETQENIVLGERNIKLLQEQLELRQQVIDANRAERQDPTAGARRALTEYLQLVKDAGTSTREAVGSAIGALEDDLTNSLASGKFSIKNFVTSAIAEFYRLQVVRPLLQSLFGGGGAGGIFGSLFGGKYSGSSTDPSAGNYTNSLDQGFTVGSSVRGNTTGIQRAGRPRGQTVVNNTYNVSSGVSANQVRAMLAQHGAMLKQDILRSARTGGSFAT